MTDRCTAANAEKRISQSPWPRDFTLRDPKAAERGDADKSPKVAWIMQRTCATPSPLGMRRSSRRGGHISPRAESKRRAIK